MSTTTDTLDAIRARHVPTAGTQGTASGLPNASCSRCGGYWPCDTAIVIAALDAALARERRLRQAHDYMHHPGCECPVGAALAEPEAGS